MKKTYSFHLEEDIVDRIEKYKLENNLSSRSAALERLILKLDNFNINEDKIKEVIKEIINESSITYDENLEKNVAKKVKNLNENLDKSIKEVFDDMPE